MRRIIYTTNAIEALNSKLRRAVRTRGHFPNDDAAMTLLYLVPSNAAKDWKRPPREGVEAKKLVRPSVRRPLSERLIETDPSTEFVIVPFPKTQVQTCIVHLSCAIP